MPVRSTRRVTGGLRRGKPHPGSRQLRLAVRDRGQQTLPAVRLRNRRIGPPQDVDRPLNGSPNNSGMLELPPARPAWIWYPYSPSTRFPETGSGGRTACAGPFYYFQADLDSDRKLPAVYDGVQFIYEWERGWILAARADENGAPVLERFAPEIDLKRPVEMELGPDGALYVIEFGTGWENNRDAQIVRIEPGPPPGEAGLADAGPGVRRDSQEHIDVPSDPREAMRETLRLLDSGELRAQQRAFAMLGRIPGNGADQMVGDWLGRLLEGGVPAPLQLDVLDAASRREAEVVRDSLARFEAARPEADPARNYLECLEGGDAENGRRVFAEKTEVSCARCHRAGPGIEDSSVGPDLSKIGALRDRRHLLEAIVAPNAFVAPGFEYVLVKMKSGKEYSGLLKTETDRELQIESPEDGSLTLSIAEIDSRGHGLSAMPPGLGQVLTKFELRDLVEFLGSLK